MRIVTLNEATRKNILETLLKRSPNQYEEQTARVAEILAAVKEQKDKALFAYTEQFDHVRLTGETVRVTKAEIEQAYQKLPQDVLEVIKKAAANITAYHAKQKQYSWFDSEPSGILLGQKVTPLASVGVYVPGGKAAYPSSVLMNVLPAKVVGVERIVMVTPPASDGSVYEGTLVAAHEAGVTEIYKVGGAQAIAALAFGTESVPKVDKITGPGNIYVALAKKAV